MDGETEGYEVAQSEEFGHWYVIRRQWKGTVFHRTILADQYNTQKEAEEASEAMQQAVI